MVTVGRRYVRKREMRLVELLVGDDTRAGFEITVWLAGDPQMAEEPAHRSLLSQRMPILRPRDIVLLRNVALGAYQGESTVKVCEEMSPRWTYYIADRSIVQMWKDSILRKHCLGRPGTTRS